MIHLSEIIIKPILTDKTYKQMNQEVYTFKVNRKSNKSYIKKTFEKIFEVKVLNINIINVKSKIKVTGKLKGKKPQFKKAIIKLLSGEKLTLLNSNS